MNASRRHVLIAGFIGNVVEWYDFALYGFFASVFARIFFPESSDTANLIAVYGIFAAGFVMRPAGSVLFGWLGDRLGRSPTMMISVALMAVPTVALGLLPSYATIGIAAPIILVCLRLVQGLSIGGEFSTSVVYLVETAADDRRGRSGSLANLGSISGTAFGSLLAMAVLNLLPEDQAHAWGWRLPYFLGGVIGVAALWLRRHLPKSQAFQEQEKQRGDNAPIRETLTTTLTETVQATVFAGGYGVLFYLGTVYFPNWLSSQGGVALDSAMRINTLALLLTLPVVYLSGWASDALVRRRFLIAGALLFVAVVGAASFALSADAGLIVAGVSQICLALALGVLLGAAPALFVALFPARNRNTGYSISYAIGMGVMGGATPMTATWLIEQTGSPLAPAFMLAAAALIGAGAVLSMRRTETLE